MSISSVSVGYLGDSVISKKYVHPNANCNPSHKSENLIQRLVVLKALFVSVGVKSIFAELCKKSVEFK